MKLGWFLTGCHFASNLLVTQFASDELKVEGLQIFQPTTDIDRLREIFSVVPIVAEYYDSGYGYPTAMVFGDVIGCYAATFLLFVLTVLLFQRFVADDFLPLRDYDEVPGVRSMRRGLFGFGLLMLAFFIVMPALVLIAGMTFHIGATAVELLRAIISRFSGPLFEANVCLTAALVSLVLAIGCLKSGAPRWRTRASAVTSHKRQSVIVRRSPHSR